MKTKHSIAIFVFCLLASALSGCSASPQALANDWQAALNSGDIDLALSYLAEDAQVRIIPPGDESNGIYNGREAVGDWYRTIVAANGAGQLRDCKSQGDELTCLTSYSDDGLKAIGVDFIEGEWKAVIRNKKIQSYQFEISPESLAKFPPPEPVSAETRVTQAQTLLGKWDARTSQYVVIHDFQADGGLLVSIPGVGMISRGRYWFENDLLMIEDISGDCQGIIGSYETYAVYEDEKITLLRFVLQGEDRCNDRKQTLAGNTMSLH